MSYLLSVGSVCVAMQQPFGLCHNDSERLQSTMGEDQGVGTVTVSGSSSLAQSCFCFPRAKRMCDNAGQNRTSENFCQRKSS